MNNAKLTRRGFASTAATGLAALGLLGSTVRSASAYQGNMERALGSLQEALQLLQESTPNKGGHRERAMDLVRQAMERAKGNKSQAARLLGLTRATLRYRLDKYGLDDGVKSDG